MSKTKAKKGPARHESTEAVEFNGVIYRRKRGRKYFETNRWDSVRKRYYADSLHRAVWRFHNGEIPAGSHIHHKDKNTNNNDITNLECLSPKQHACQHPDEIRHRGSFANRRHLKKAQRRLAEWRERRQPIEIKCEECGQVFSTKHNEPSRVRFCGRKCQSRNYERRLRDSRIRPDSRGSS